MSSRLGLPFLSYNNSIYSLHLFLTSSGSVNNFPLLSLTDMLLLHFLLFFLVNSFTFAYIKSARPRLSNSSNSLHSFSHHSSFALSVFLLNSLFSWLYFVFPSSVFILFHSLRSSILLIISVVIHGFLADCFPLKPMISVALLMTVSFNSVHLSSTLPFPIGFSLFSMSFCNSLPFIFSCSTFHFLFLFPLNIFFNFISIFIATRLWSEYTSAPG